MCKWRLYSIYTFPEINTEALQPDKSFCERSLIWYWARSTSYRQLYCWLLQTFPLSTREDSLYSFETIVWNFTTYDLWISERTICYIMTVKSLIASTKYFVTLSWQTGLWNPQSRLWVRVCACVRVSACFLDTGSTISLTLKRNIWQVLWGF